MAKCLALCSTLVHTQASLLVRHIHCTFDPYCLWSCLGSYPIPIPLRDSDIHTISVSRIPAICYHNTQPWYVILVDPALPHSAFGANLQRCMKFNEI